MLTKPSLPPTIDAVDYLKQQRELQKLLEESTGMKHLRSMEATLRHLIEPMRTPYMGVLGETVAEMQRQSERHQEMLRSLGGVSSLLNLNRAMLGVAPTSFQSLLEAANTRNSLFERYTSDGLFARSSALESLQSVREGILGEKFFSSEWLRPQLLGDLTAISETFSVLRDSQAATVASALEGWREVRELALAGVSVNPLAETARFLRRSSETLARQENPIVTQAVETAVALTDIELRATRDLLEGMDVDDEPETVPERRLVVPRRQQYEVQRHAEALDGLDLEEVLGILPVGQVVLVAREVVGVVVEINQASLLAGSPPIFKLTQRVSRVFAELPFTLATNERTFADVIDDLYWLVYEAPGSGSLRFLKANGGPIADTECEIVFVIKRLRNFFRHDPEHGSAREIEKKLEAVRADLSKRGFPQGLPRTRREYEHLHRLLLEETAAFLRLLQSRL